MPCFLLAKDLEVEYPEVPVPGGPPAGITAGASIEQLARYIYYFSLSAGAVIALTVLVYGGFLFLTALGNPTKMQEGKNKMLSAILGLLILFSSYLILAALDPDLTIFFLPPPPAPTLPKSKEVEIPKVMPSSYVKIDSLKGDSDELADFLIDEITKITSLAEAASELDKDLEELKEGPDCSEAETWCVSVCNEGKPVRCRWEKDPGKEVLKKVDKAEQSLEGSRKIVKELITSKEAKKLRGTLKKLSNCQQDPESRLLIWGQANYRGLLKHFGLTDNNRLYFYCLY